MPPFQRARSAHERRRLSGSDHPHGNVGQQAAEPALGLETRAERRALEPGAQPRHDAATDVDPAARTQRERQVAGHRAQHGAEDVQRFQRLRVTGLQGRLAHTGRTRHTARRHAVGLAEQAVGVEQTLTATHALGRTTAVAARQAVHHQTFARGHGRQRDVAALAFQRHPAAKSVRQQARHTQPGAGADQADRRARPCHATTHRSQLRRRQVGQRQRQCGEVVEQAQRVEAELGLQRRLRKRPVVVGHADLVAGDRVGDGDRHRVRRAAPEVVQVDADRFLQGGVVRAGQHAHVGDGLTRPGLPGETGVGAAHVGEQSGAEESVGRIRHLIRSTKSVRNSTP